MPILVCDAWIPDRVHHADLVIRAAMNVANDAERHENIPEISNSMD